MVHPTLLGCLACWISPVIVTDAFKLPMFRERRGGGGQEEREQPRQPSSSTTTGTTTSTRILATMADAFEKSSVNAILNNMAGDGAGSIAGGASSSSSSSSLPSLPPFLYFHQHVTPMVSTFLHRFYEHMLAVLLYKPPVGFVMLVTATRLVTSGRLFRLYEAPSSVEDQAQLQRRRRRDLDRPTRALTLDPQDTAYQTAGGVDPIRQKLCLAALSGSRTEHDRKEHEPSPSLSATSAAATLSNKTKSNNDTIDSDNSHHYELVAATSTPNTMPFVTHGIFARDGFQNRTLGRRQRMCCGSSSSCSCSSTTRGILVVVVVQEGVDQASDAIIFLAHECCCRSIRASLSNARYRRAVARGSRSLAIDNTSLGENRVVLGKASATGASEVPNLVLAIMASWWWW
jgi:hypothetical protein